MHKRFSNFLNKSNFVYSLQFGFRHNHSTLYGLMHLTETMKQFLGQGVFSCVIFVDLQKSFTRVDHYILLNKLEDYGIGGYTKK